MPTSVTPILSASAGYEDDVATQVAALVRWFIMNPGGTSDLWEDKLISFRVLAAKYEDNPSLLASQAAKSMSTVLNSKFKDCFFNCDFTTADYKEGVKDGRYRIIFNITYGKEGNTYPALVSGTISVDVKTSAIDVKFSNKE